MAVDKTRIRDGEIAIIVAPEINENNEWTGVLKTGLLFGDQQNPLAMRAAMDAALTMAALPPNANMLEAIVLPVEQKYVGRG